MLMKIAADAMSPRSHPEASERSLLDLHLVHGSTAACTARHVLHRILSCQGVASDDIDDALLVVSELITNAVTHAHPPVSLHVRLCPAARTLTVSVADGGACPAGAATAGAAHEHGRGRKVIAAIAAAMGSTSAGPGNGKVHHWAALDLR
ncbi:ATP-binding protein [Streptomyces bryophytorum]|nr:ATP-binding protein [Actinacidiphila bryophytorum]